MMKMWNCVVADTDVCTDAVGSGIKIWPVNLFYMSHHERFHGLHHRLLETLKVAECKDEDDDECGVEGADEESWWR